MLLLIAGGRTRFDLTLDGNSLNGLSLSNLLNGGLSSFLVSHGDIYDVLSYRMNCCWFNDDENSRSEGRMSRPIYKNSLLFFHLSNCDGVSRQLRCDSLIQPNGNMGIWPIDYVQLGFQLPKELMPSISGEKDRSKREDGLSLIIEGVWSHDENGGSSFPASRLGSQPNSLHI